MNLIIFARTEAGVARVMEILETPKPHVYVDSTLGGGLDHDTTTPQYDSVTLDINKLFMWGVKEIRLEAVGAPRSVFKEVRGHVDPEPKAGREASHQQ